MINSYCIKLDDEETATLREFFRIINWYNGKDYAEYQNWHNKCMEYHKLLKRNYGIRDEVTVSFEWSSGYLRIYKI